MSTKLFMDKRTGQVVSAVQWFPEKEDVEGVSFYSPGPDQPEPIPAIHIAGGIVSLISGDWVITRPDGSHSLCGPAEFAKHFLPVESSDFAIVVPCMVGEIWWDFECWTYRLYPVGIDQAMDVRLGILDKKVKPISMQSTNDLFFKVGDRLKIRIEKEGGDNA